MAHTRQKIRFGLVGLVGGKLGADQLGILFLQFLIHSFVFSHIARGGKYPLQAPISVIESGGVVRDHGLLAIARARGQFVVVNLFFAEYQFDAHLGPLWIGEAVLERRAD